MTEPAHTDIAFLGDVQREYPDYLRDESRRVGRAETISFPRSEAELQSHVRHAAQSSMPITIQGGRTGIAAGAVPERGHVINLSRMTRVRGLRRDARTGDFLLTAEPGLLLSALRERLAKKEFDAEGWPAESLRALADLRAAGEYFFSPDPTETSATIGGMAACNASGARSYFFKATRRYVERLHVVLADGSRLALERGREKCRGRLFSAVTDEGRRIEGQVPGYRMPAVKNASGYFAEDDMDLADLFIGAEGTLGVISEVEVRLLPAPAAAWGVMAFFPAEEPALAFAEALRAPPIAPVAIEFFDRGALNLLRRQRETNPAFKEIPAMPAEDHTAIYVEFFGDSNDAVENEVSVMADRLTEAGGDMDATWLAAEHAALNRLKDFRHAVPEAVNLTIDERRKREPGLTKLGTDLSVPDAFLRQILARYHGDLGRAGLEYVVFGHIGNSHLHVNIIPRTMAEYRHGKALCLEWARAVVSMGGSVSAEHGIGKLKTDLLREMYGERGIAEMKALKKAFDPAGLLNPGNLFP